MKNIKIVFILIFTAVMFSACSFMGTSNTYVQIYDCIHGSVDVQVKEEKIQETDFIIYIYPDEGYELDVEKLYIMDHNKSGYSKSRYYDDDEARVFPVSTENKNIYYFTASNNARITITAFFTKK